MYERHELGKTGEEIGTQYLINNGYKLIIRNFRCRQGEVDIIAKDKDEIVFIEVKTRRNTNYGYPIDAVDKRKQKHILNASKYYVYKNKLEKRKIRFDVIEIYKKDKFYFIVYKSKIVLQKMDIKSEKTLTSIFFFSIIKKVYCVRIKI